VNVQTYKYKRRKMWPIPKLKMEKHQCILFQGTVYISLNIQKKLETWENHQAWLVVKNSSETHDINTTNTFSGGSETQSLKHGILNIHCTHISQILTNNSSMLVFHFSRFIRLMAHFSCLGLQKAPWTTAVAPTPAAGTKC
jgi:hypothetical protein